MMSTKLENMNQKIQFLTKSGIRLHILNVLNKNPKNIKELVNTTQITYSTLSSNLHIITARKIYPKNKKQILFNSNNKNVLEYNIGV